MTPAPTLRHSLATTRGHSLMLPSVPTQLIASFSSVPLTIISVANTFRSACSKLSWIKKIYLHALNLLSTLNPSWRHITLASLLSQESWHTITHRPPLQYSTRPSFSASPSCWTNLTSLSWHSIKEGYLNVIYCDGCSVANQVTYNDGTVSSSIIGMSALLHNRQPWTFIKPVFITSTVQTIQNNRSCQVPNLWHISEHLIALISGCVQYLCVIIIIVGHTKLQVYRN